jgi:phage baseplate assembly protein W
MAIIDLNNLIQPKQVNSSGISVSKQVQVTTPIYSDLHLDLTTSETPNQSVGIGLNPVESRDIASDSDIQAIKNSLRNLFTTIPGQKVLNPTFGCSLLKYLFEPVSVLGANAIGNDINNAITQFEPRVSVVSVYVLPNPTSTPVINLNGTQLTLQSVSDINSLGAGYAVSLVYDILPLSVQDNLSIFAQLGGQILI